jgi:hypothetical protein
MEVVAAKALASTAVTSTTAAAGTFAAAGGTSLAAGTFAGVGAGSAAAGAGLMGAGGVASATGFGAAMAGIGSALSSFSGLGSSVLTGLQVVGAVDSVVNPFMEGQRAADIAEVNAAQTDLDIQQKLLQGRESSVRALETLNQQSAHNIAAGFASGIGLSPSVASSIDSITRKHRFDDTLTRTSNILEAGSLQRKSELQRAQGQTAKVRGTFESLGAVAPAVKTVKSLFT